MITAKDGYKTHAMVPAVLVHDRFLVCDSIGTGTAASADVSGCHDSCAVIAAEEIEGYKDLKSAMKIPATRTIPSDLQAEQAL